MLNAQSSGFEDETKIDKGKSIPLNECVGGCEVESGDEMVFTNYIQWTAHLNFQMVLYRLLSLSIC